MRRLFSWHNCVVQTSLLPSGGGLSDDRVYPRIVRIYSPFFAPCGGGIYRRAGVERRGRAAVAGGGLTRSSLLSRLRRLFPGWTRIRSVSSTPWEQMLSQRIYGLALGYEDLNDHEQLRSDPLFGLLSGRRKLEEPLAGKSTLNRLELTGRSLRYRKIEALAGSHRPSAGGPVHRVAREERRRPRSCSTWTHRPTSRFTAISQTRFFHGYYDSYCYLPLYIFAGDQLLCARLRPANQDAAAGSVKEVERHRWRSYASAGPR